MLLLTSLSAEYSHLTINETKHHIIFIMSPINMVTLLFRSLLSNPMTDVNGSTEQKICVSYGKLGTMFKPNCQKDRNLGMLIKRVGPSSVQS